MTTTQMIELDEADVPLLQGLLARERANAPPPLEDPLEQERETKLDPEQLALWCEYCLQHGLPAGTPFETSQVEHERFWWAVDLHGPAGLRDQLGKRRAESEQQAADEARRAEEDERGLAAWEEDAAGLQAELEERDEEVLRLHGELAAAKSARKQVAGRLEVATMAVRRLADEARRQGEARARRAEAARFESAVTAVCNATGRTPSEAADVLHELPDVGLAIEWCHRRAGDSVTPVDEFFGV